MDAILWIFVALLSNPSGPVDELFYYPASEFSVRASDIYSYTSGSTINSVVAGFSRLDLGLSQIDRNAAVREFSFINGDSPLWEYFYGGESDWNVITCDELYGLVNTNDGYACVGYQAGNASKIPDASDPYQPEFLVLEEIDSSGDSDVYLYSIGGDEIDDICGRDILRVMDGSTEYLVSCGWFTERGGSGLRQKGYVERREIGKISPDYNAVFTNVNFSYDCEEMFEDDGYLFIMGSSVPYGTEGVRGEYIWVLDISDLELLDSCLNTASANNLLMGCIAQINSEYFVTCGESYSSSSPGLNDLAITLWNWDSSSEELSVVDEKTYSFTGYNREGAFEVFVVEDTYGDPIGLYVFCDSEQSTGDNSNGILVAYIELQDMSSNPTLASTAENCLFMVPDSSYGLTDGNDVGGESVDYVYVDGETVAVCLASPVKVANGGYLSRNAIWICTVTGIDNPPSERSDQTYHRDAQLPTNGDVCLHPSVSPYYNQSYDIIRLNYENSSEIHLFDISGRKIWSSFCPESCGVLEVSNEGAIPDQIQPGIYFAVAYNNSESSSACELLVLE